MLATLSTQNRFIEAEALARSFTMNFPRYGYGWKMLGVALHQQKRIEEAQAAMQKAVDLLPDDAELHNNLGSIFLGQDQLIEAEASLCKALEINPDNVEAHSNLGFVFLKQGRLVEAEASFRKSLDINLGLGEAQNRQLFYHCHNEKIDAATLSAEHCRFGEQFEAPLRASWLQHSNSREPDRCLQIGFVSGDLCDHAVSTFIEPVLAHLSGYPQLVLHAYYNRNLEDSVTLRLRRYLTHWHSIVGLSDDVLAEKIRADGIDILIDLSGHTDKNRLLTFARKPAPVQASWMGYPYTTGLSAMDYYLADRFLLPPGQFDDQFTEKIVRLPANAPYQPNMAAPQVNALPALSNGYVTFGSFNRQNKLSPSVIALWSQLLHALPSSRMVLGGMPADGQYDALLGWFTKEGIGPERLSFYRRCDLANYFALHRQVDICLDTFPYNGGTTTYNALWMGVPTLTLAGRTVPARQGATILGHVGLNAFVAEDSADFVRKGLSWASHPSSLANVRTHLRERIKQSAIGQPAMIGAALECALRKMWQRWCDGLPAESFEVKLEDIGNIMDKVGS